MAPLFAFYVLLSRGENCRGRSMKSRGLSREVSGAKTPKTKKLHDRTMGSAPLSLLAFLTTPCSLLQARKSLAHSSQVGYYSRLRSSLPIGCRYKAVPVVIAEKPLFHLQIGGNRLRTRQTLAEPESESPASLSVAMRRPSSSSCLLLPKSPDKREDNEVTSPSSLSVTILSKQKLPTFSCERFYMLSEIEMHAQPNTFLCDLRGGQQAEDNSTQATEETEEEDAASKEPGSPKPAFPPFVLLYVLWRPDMPSDPRTFVETSLLDAVNRIREHVEIVSSLEEASATSALVRSASSGSLVPAASPPRRGSPARDERDKAGAHSSGSSPRNQRQSEAEGPPRPKASLYLVVDRPVPWPSADDETPSPDSGSSRSTESHAAQEELAERLARTVASHPVLRTCLEGITVGISNHERAAPALEACVEAVALGAPDRRRLAAKREAPPATTTAIETDPQKSLLGMVATAPDELLGLQEATVTDAAQVSADTRRKGYLCLGMDQSL